MNLVDKYVIDGNLESIKTVINGNDWKLDSKWNDYNLLKKALIYKHKEIIKFFIANNFRVNKFSILDADTTPLHIAVELGWEDIVLLLLEKGASVEVQDSTNKLTPIQLSFIMRKYQLTDLMLPFDKGQTIHDPDTDVNHLHIACARNCITAVKNYLRLGEYIDTYTGLTFINSFGYTPLHFAVDFQSRETVELLLKCGASITAKDKKQNTPLHLASNLHDKSLIDLLLFEHRYNSYNPTNLCKVSHFHIACTRNNLKVVYGFLQCGVDINATVAAGPWEGYTALHLAVIHKCTDVIKLLLSQDNLVKDNSEIFLFNVYKTENSEIINLITSRNKSLLTTELSGQIPLKPFFRACIKGDKDEIKSLLSSNVPVNECLPLDSLLFPGATPLHILVEHDCNFISEIIDLILQKGADVTIKDARGLTPIHVIFQKDYIMKPLMNVPSRFKMNVSDEEGLSIFHIACAVGTEEIVEWFLDNIDVDVNAAVSEDSLWYPGFTPLHMAASHTRVKVFLKLLSHGVNIMIKNRQGLTSFDLLFQNWSFNIDDNPHHVVHVTMTQLIEVYRKHYTTSDALQFPLLLATCLSNQKDMVEYAVKNQIALAPVLNSALNSTCGLFGGFTPLHCAVWVNNVNMIQTLLNQGADPAALTNEGDTPLHMSMRYLKESVLNLKTKHLELNILFRILDVDDRLFLLQKNPFGSCGFSHFHIACYLGKLDLVKAFLDRGIDPDIRIRRPLRKAANFESEGAMWINETGLHAALRAGHRDVVLLLLERGANANAPDMYQHTFLHNVPADDEDLVKLLVENGGADVNARNSNNETPLHSACRTDDPRSVVDALLEAGADIDLMDQDGQTAIHIAADTYDPDMSNELLIPVLQHALRLQVAGCQISKENETAVSLNREQLIDDDDDADVGEDFVTHCSEELERMECVRFDGRTTLRDVPRIRNVNWLRTLAGNKLFQRLVEDELYEGEKKISLDDFPNYGYLVRLQFRRGWKRRQLMLAAALAIGKIVERYCTRFPDECADILLSYLTDDDLGRLIQATK